jgi:hypothetical protein
LYGNAPQEGNQAIMEFNGALKLAPFKIEDTNTNLFSKVNPPFIGQRQGNLVTWNFNCDLNRLGAE